MKKFLIGLAVVFVAVVACSVTPRPASNVGPLPSTSSGGVAVSAPTTSAAPPTGPVSKFGDGTYEVGPDIVAGRYKTPGDGASSCYYARESDDSSGNIIQNDFFKGPGSFTAKKGEFVKVSGGCAWTKQ